MLALRVSVAQFLESLVVSTSLLFGRHISLTGTENDNSCIVADRKDLAAFLAIDAQVSGSTSAEERV